MECSVPSVLLARVAMGALMKGLKIMNRCCMFVENFADCVKKKLKIIGKIHYLCRILDEFEYIEFWLTADRLKYFL